MFPPGKLREALRVMNCPDRVYWATWTLTHAVLSLFTVGGCTWFISAMRTFLGGAQGSLALKGRNS